MFYNEKNQENISQVKKGECKELEKKICQIALREEEVFYENSKKRFY